MLDHDKKCKPSHAFKMNACKKLRVEWSEVGEWGSQTKIEDKTEQDVLLFLLQCSIQSKCMFRQRDVWLCTGQKRYVMQYDYFIY